MKARIAILGCTSLVLAGCATFSQDGGFGAMNATSNTLNAPPAPASDELENTNGNLDTVSRTKSTLASSVFDDMVLSVSRFTLIHRMVAAGKLP